MGIINKIKEIVGGIKEEGEVIKGEKTKDKHFFSSREFANEFNAIEGFGLAKERLFDVNAWSNIPAIVNSTFEIYDQDGKPVRLNRPRPGDFIKIILPGPLPENWVRVVDVKEEESIAEFSVQPSYNPINGNPKKTEHFFDSRARSIFRVERKGTEVTAHEIGLHEGVNNEGEEAGGRKVVNTLISEGGWAGFQKYQWKNLTDYLVGEND